MLAPLVPSAAITGYYMQVFIFLLFPVLYVYIGIFYTYWLLFTSIYIFFISSVVCVYIGIFYQIPIPIHIHISLSPHTLALPNAMQLNIIFLYIQLDPVVPEQGGWGDASPQ